MSQAALAKAHDFEGKLERATLDRVEGWAWDKNNDDPVFVNIFIDGGLVCTVVADQLRGDLQSKGKRGGFCAFSVIIPEEYIDGRRHNVRAAILHSEPQFVLGDLTSEADDKDSSIRQMQSTVSFYRPTAPHKNSSARALLGKNSWLFLANDSNRVRDQIAGRFTVTQAMKDNYRAVFDERRKKFKKLGIPYFFFIAPTKERICMEYLPAGLATDFEMMPASVIRRLLNEDGSPLFALDEALQDEQAKNETFYRTDTHWNYIGAYRAYKEIIEVVSNFIDCGRPHARESFGSKILKKYRGDLANKEKVVFIGEEYPLLSIAPNDIDPVIFQEDVEQLFDITGDIINLPVSDNLKVSQTRTTVVFGNKNKNLPKALVFRDSFAINLAPMMARHFSEIIYVWRPEVFFSLIESEKPDVVIQIMLDRFMVRQQANIF